MESKIQKTVEFKIGDKVRVIDRDGDKSVQIGDTGIVRAIGDSAMHTTS